MSEHINLSRLNRNAEEERYLKKMKKDKEKYDKLTCYLENEKLYNR